MPKFSKLFSCENGHQAPAPGDCSYCEEYCWFPQDQVPALFEIEDYLPVQETEEEEEGKQWILINHMDPRPRSLIRLPDVMTKRHYKEVAKHLSSRARATAASPNELSSSSS